MPVTLIPRQVTRTPDGDWYFGFTRTRQSSAVGEVGAQDLSNEVVLQIFRQTIGPEPATGLEAENIRENWDRLEPPLRAEIEKRVGAV